MNTSETQTRSSEATHTSDLQLRTRLLIRRFGVRVPGPHFMLSSISSRSLVPSVSRLGHAVVTDATFVLCPETTGPFRPSARAGATAGGGDQVSADGETIAGTMLLARTAALGEAVVTRPQLPSRIRQVSRSRAASTTNTWRHPSKVDDGTSDSSVKLPS